MGWVIYNVMETKNGKKGYVMLAQNMARNFANRGWGKYYDKKRVKTHNAGDIMSSSGHVYIVVGTCTDGSVVLLHSSPPGVQLCGTSTPKGNSNSMAVKLARKYMRTYYPSYYKKFPNCSRGTSYLTDYHKFRWNLKSNVMSDPDGYRKMTPEKILKDLFRKKPTG